MACVANAHNNVNSTRNEKMKILPLLSIAAVIASPTFAEDTRQADSHEHGVGQLDIAFEGSNISMELHAPGADIVGFEYAATSEEDHKAIDAAIATLSKPFELFNLPTGAGCKVIEASAELEGDESHEDEHDDDHKDEHDDEHDDHKDEHGDDHKDEHDDNHGDDHKDDDHSDHEGEEASHTEFHAEYLFECTDLNAVTKILFPYFEAFPNAQELELQVVSEKGAAAFEVERDAASVDLSELF